MFELELDEHDEALRLYDEAVGGTGSAVVLDLIDASAMLWRLRLRGVDVGGRWDSVADRWAAVLAGGGAGQYAFNDVHAMLAYVGADRAAAQGELLGAMEDTAREKARTTANSRGTSACRSLAQSRRSAPATPRAPWRCCARCAARPIVSAAAMHSAT